MLQIIVSEALGVLYGRGLFRPWIAKAFNVIEASKASQSKLAGHLSESWSTTASWLHGITRLFKRTMAYSISGSVVLSYRLVLCQ
ncbi:MAG: hypothetical protein K8R76_05955 [Candidatus Aegiribacteria sp.]|nr:hypothetical protein [Candidatus Aegiribacteria sp.]